MSAIPAKNRKKSDGGRGLGETNVFISADAKSLCDCVCRWLCGDDKSSKTQYHTSALIQDDSTQTKQFLTRNFPHSSCANRHARAHPQLLRIRPIIGAAFERRIAFQLCSSILFVRTRWRRSLSALSAARANNFFILKSENSRRNSK